MQGAALPSAPLIVEMTSMWSRRKEYVARLLFELARQMWSWQASYQQGCGSATLWPLYQLQETKSDRELRMPLGKRKLHPELVILEMTNMEVDHVFVANFFLRTETCKFVSGRSTEDQHVQQDSSWNPRVLSGQGMTRLCRQMVDMFLRETCAENVKKMLTSCPTKDI